jgi:hypothetical protein
MTTKHLHLVGSEPIHRARKPRPTFSPEHRARLAVALKNLRRLYGTWAALADAMGINEGTLKNVNSGRCGSMTIVVRAAQVAGVPVERLLSGEITSTNTCHRCGQAMPQEVKP